MRPEYGAGELNPPANLRGWQIDYPVGLVPASSRTRKDVGDSWVIDRSDHSSRKVGLVLQIPFIGGRKFFLVLGRCKYGNVANLGTSVNLVKGREGGLWDMHACISTYLKGTRCSIADTLKRNGPGTSVVSLGKLTGRIIACHHGSIGA